MLSNEISETITNAQAMALATRGEADSNVVPVSVVEIHDDQIVLFDFFMGKTVQNLQTDPQVAFTAWSGLQGVQVKATARYETTGELYENAVSRMQERFPERTLRGLIILTPTSIYDISAGVTAGTQLV